MINQPIIELISILAAAIGCGISFWGWIDALQQHKENLLEGINGSIGMTSQWRIQRERSRMLMQLVILVSGILVMGWRARNPQYYDPLILIYVTRSVSHLFISLMLMSNAMIDRRKRTQIASVVREEYKRDRRAVEAGGRRVGDKPPTQVLVTAPASVTVHAITEEGKK